MERYGRRPFGESGITVRTCAHIITQARKPVHEANDAERPLQHEMPSERDAFRLFLVLLHGAEKISREFSSNVFWIKKSRMIVKPLAL